MWKFLNFFFSFSQKPENLLLVSPDADADVKVADFGLAAVVSQDIMLFDAVGTPNYIAPEILLCLEEVWFIYWFVYYLFVDLFVFFP
jgi:serine/threonine protein kinase